MNISTTRFGTLDFESDDVIEFPEGLLGFPDAHQFILFVHRGGPFSWLQSIDIAVPTFARLQPSLGSLSMRPSDYVRRQIKFSPFAGEPLGWIIENAGPELLVFGSDYPHPEGTSNPIEKFEATMQGCDDSVMDAFYHGNMLDVMGS